MANSLTIGKRTQAILSAVWEAAGDPWSVRLKALRMPWIRKRFHLG